jgi:hypothetical protein
MNAPPPSGPEVPDRAEQPQPDNLVGVVFEVDQDLGEPPGVFPAAEASD